MADQKIVAAYKACMRDPQAERKVQGSVTYCQNAQEAYVALSDGTLRTRSQFLPQCKVDFRQFDADTALACAEVRINEFMDMQSTAQPPKAKKAVNLR